MRPVEPPALESLLARHRDAVRRARWRHHGWPLTAAALTLAAIAIAGGTRWAGRPLRPAEALMVGLLSATLAWALAAWRVSRERWDLPRTAALVDRRWDLADRTRSALSLTGGSGPWVAALRLDATVRAVALDPRQTPAPQGRTAPTLAAATALACLVTALLVTSRAEARRADRSQRASAATAGDRGGAGGSDRPSDARRGGPRKQGQGQGDGAGQRPKPRPDAGGERKQPGAAQPKPKPGSHKPKPTPTTTTPKPKPKPQGAPKTRPKPRTRPPRPRGPRMGPRSKLAVRLRKVEVSPLFGKGRHRLEDGEALVAHGEPDKNAKARPLDVELHRHYERLAERQLDREVIPAEDKDLVQRYLELIRPRASSD